MTFLTPCSRLPPTVCERRQVQLQGQVPLSPQLHWQVLPDASSQWTTAAATAAAASSAAATAAAAASAAAGVCWLQSNSGPLPAHAAPHLQPRPTSW